MDQNARLCQFQKTILMFYSNIHHTSTTQAEINSMRRRHSIPLNISHHDTLKSQENIRNFES